MDRDRILVFGGSLRKGSFSTALMYAAPELSPENVEIELFERLGEFPPFNADLVESPPRVVTDFKARIREADAILIVTPEYNYSIPGYLKNAIDWASRPSGDNPLNGKPAALISSSTGTLGGSRAQYHMRQCLVYLDMHPINKPECIVSNAKDKISADGRVVDQKTREKVTDILTALSKWTRRLNK
jgi:chromate reductase, NAD(P)H dehydrogenase (quinone)